MEKEVIVDGMEMTIDPTEVQSEETTTEVSNETKVETKSNDLITKQAGYYSRHPEELELLIKQTEALKIKKAPKTDNLDAANEIRQLRIENAIKDAVIEHNLSKEDIQWIQGSSPEEIHEKASKFIEYKKSLGIMNTNSDKNDTDDSPLSDSKYVRQNTSPVGSKKPQTLDELETELRGMKIKI